MFYKKVDTGSDNALAKSKKKNKNKRQRNRQKRLICLKLYAYYAEEFHSEITLNVFRPFYAGEI